MNGAAIVVRGQFDKDRVLATKDMAKVTSKLQVTLPKAIASAHGIKPGDEIEWASAGEVIRIVPARSGRKVVDAAERPAPEGRGRIFPVLYPNEEIVRLALRGAAAYQLSWFDAHLWAYAEHYGLRELFSEDFQHDRLYGTVRIVKPFV